MFKLAMPTRNKFNMAAAAILDFVFWGIIQSSIEIDLYTKFHIVTENRYLFFSVFCR